MQRPIVSRILTLVLVLTFLLGAGWMTSRFARAASDLYVAPDGNDTGDCKVNPCASIGYAISQAASSDTINVAAGTYTESGQLNIGSKSLTINGVGTVTVKRSAGSSYFIAASGASSVALKNLTIDASADNTTTNFVVHLSGVTSVTLEDFALVGQGRDYTTDGGAYYYTNPSNTNVVGGLDLINVGTASLKNVAVSANGRNCYAFTNVTTLSLDSIGASQCGHTSSTGWAGVALYGPTTSMTLAGTNTIANAGIGVNVYPNVTLPLSGNIAITNTGLPISAPNSPASDAFAETVAGAPYKVYALTGPTMGMAGYYNTQATAVAGALAGKAIFGVDFMVFDLDTDQFVVGEGMSIQAAIDAAAPGDTLYVATGTYYESDITVNKALTLSGAGQGSTFIVPDPLKVDDATCHPTNGTVHHGIIVAANDVTIKDLTIDGETARGYRMGITSYYWTGGNYNNTTIQDVTVTNIHYRGIVIRRNGALTTGHKVLGATVTHGGCDVQGFAILGFNVDQIEIKDSHVADWKQGIATGNYTGTPSRCDIQGNTVEDVENQAYTLTLNGAGSVFDGNTAIFNDPGNQGTGLVTYQDEITLTNNTFTGAMYGISVGFQTLAKDKLVIGAGNVVTGPGTDVEGSIGIDVSDYSWAGAARNFTMMGTTVTGYETGIWFDPQLGMTSDALINENRIFGNGFGLQNDLGASIDATRNWWGTPCDPGDLISSNVDYSPWWGDPDGNSEVDEALLNNLLVPNGATGELTNAILACAAPGSTVDFEAAGTFEGGIVVNKPGLTINLNGGTVAPGSPAFTIEAANVTIQGPGVLAGNATDPGILVKAGGDNFTLRDVEVREWAAGVRVEASVTSFKIVGNWFHNNGVGLLLDSGVTLGGVVTIEGNLFKENTGNGIQNNSGNEIVATYNSWGHVDGPDDGDGVSDDVVYAPWTFAEVYFDVEPDTEAIQRDVEEGATFDVALKVEAANLHSVQFRFAYDDTLLTYNGLTWDADWDPASVDDVFCVPLTGLAANEIGYVCTRFGDAAIAWDGGPIATFRFTADGVGLTGDGPWQALLDIAHDVQATAAAAYGGVRVYVNNAGFNAPSTADRDITDANDGQIDITGLANFTGFVDLQGRTNDSGATLEVFDQATKSGATLLAQGSSASSGAYTTAYVSPYRLTVGATYWFQINRPLYLPTTPIAATAWSHTGELITRPLTTLNTVLLLGGDATDDDLIDLSDAVCIGDQYGSMTPGFCNGSTGWADVNGDGKVDLLDLVLMGGNYEKTYSSWTP